MATQNLLQRLDAAAETTGSSADASNRRIEEVFICAETTGISSGDAVALDMSQTADSDKALKVVKADSGTATDKLCIGVALEDAVDGANIRVCIRGFCEANVATISAAGTLLQIGATAGRLDVRTVAVDEGGSATFNLFPIIAIAAEVDTSNVATVYVYPQF
jgi:hypothetical protein